MPSEATPQTEPELQPVLAELLAREPIFHRPKFASTLDGFARMMSSDYWEIGASGRHYSRDYILEALARSPPVDADAAGWRIMAATCRRLGETTCLLTYTLRQGERHTRRATIWQSTATGWQIVYHQGTIITEENDAFPPEIAQHS